MKAGRPFYKAIAIACFLQFSDESCLGPRTCQGESIFNKCDTIEGVETKNQFLRLFWTTTTRRTDMRRTQQRTGNPLQTPRYELLVGDQMVKNIRFSLPRHVSIPIYIWPTCQADYEPLISLISFYNIDSRSFPSRGGAVIELGVRIVIPHRSCVSTRSRLPKEHRKWRKPSGL